MNELFKNEDRNKIPNGNEQKKIESISDLVMVHLTDYIPVDGVIKSSKDAGAFGESTFQIGEKTYNIPVPSERDTIHFCLNGEVTGHSLGDWTGAKYAIIVPFEKMDIQNIAGGITVDTYTKGSVQLPQGSYILCPQDEVENIRKLTNNLMVVGYEGECVDGYANMFLSSALGYKKQEIGAWGWNNQNDVLAVENIYKELGLQQCPHSLSDENKETVTKMAIHKCGSVLKLINEQNLITDKQTYKDAKLYLRRAMSTDITTTTDTLFTILSDEKFTQQLFQKMEETLQHGIPEEYKEKIQLLWKDAQTLDENQPSKESTYFRQTASDEIKDELVNYCLEPYKQEYLKPVMDEYISQYQQLMQKNLQLSPEEREGALQNLSDSLNEEIFSSENIKKTFFDKLQRQGIILTDDEKIAISTVLQQGDTNTIKSEEMKRFIQLHRGQTTEMKLVSRILSKKMEDEVINGKKVTELSDDEKEILKGKIKDLTITSEDGYSIGLKYSKLDMTSWKDVDAIGEFTPYIEDNIGKCPVERLKGIKYFNISEDMNIYTTNFTPMKDNETIGQYLARIQECIELINRQISGENIVFNENGTQQIKGEIGRDIQELFAQENIGLSEINAVTTEMREDLTKTQQQQVETEEFNLRRIIWKI